MALASAAASAAALGSVGEGGDPRVCAPPDVRLEAVPTPPAPPVAAPGPAGDEDGADEGPEPSRCPCDLDGSEKQLPIDE